MSAADCCKGEPSFGDPRGLHSLDCPVYLESMAALEGRRMRRSEPAPPVAELDRMADENEDLRVDLGVRTGMLRRAEQSRDAISAIAHRAALAAGVDSLFIDDVRRGVDALIADRDEARHELAHAEFEVGKLKTQRDHLRDGLAAAVAELRELAAANRRDACNLSQPHVWGPTRAAEAYERAAAIVEQKLGGA